MLHAQRARPVLMASLRLPNALRLQTRPAPPALQIAKLAERVASVPSAIRVSRLLLTTNAILTAQPDFSKQQTGPATTAISLLARAQAQHCRKRLRASIHIL